MATIDSGNPFHISRAYQLAGARQPAAPLKVTPMAALPPQEAPGRAGGLNRLIAGFVPGRIDFAGEQPAHVQGALAMYRHPADRNTAATAVHAGRILDTTA